MLNIKNKSNLFLAAFVFAVLASFSGFAKADVEIDCSGKEGYQLAICEQQKALAEKNAESNEKAAAKAAQKREEAQNARLEAEASAASAASGLDRKEEMRAASQAATDAQAEYKKQQAAKKAAQQEMTDAIGRGDTEAAKAARNKMSAANSAAETAAANLKAANSTVKEQQKRQNAYDDLAKEDAKKAEKAEKKAAKAEIKAAKTAEKNANKDLKKAQKEYDKLQKECTKDPDACDVDALQTAQINLEAAKANADAATQNRQTVDGTATEAQTLQEDSGESSAVEESETTTQDGVSNANGNAKEAGSDTGEKIDANGNPVSQQRCAEAKDNIFHYIACKAMTTLADIRVIVYTLAGFGLIAFAFAAIFNKISWKHLANLCIALFILSMMTPFISYFTQDNGAQITYGNYLPAGFTNINGSDIDAAANCDTSKGDVCPDVTVDTSAKDSKWSWKDLKNTVKSGVNAAKTAYNTYKTVKNTVETTIDQAEKIGTAIKNTGGGLDGILDTLGEVATASDTIFSTVKTGTGAVIANTSSIANDVQKAGKSGTELAFDEENQNRIKELEKKLAAGNLTPKQQEWAKAELEQRKAAVDTNKVADAANNYGQKALDKINSVANTASTAGKITKTASGNADLGSDIGGDVVGAIFGIASAAGETVGTIEEGKQAKIDAANAEAKEKAEAEAAAKRQEEVRRNNASYSQGKQWDNSYNAGIGSSSTAKSSSGSKASTGSSSSTGGNNTGK